MSNGEGPQPRLMSNALSSQTLELQDRWNFEDFCMDGLPESLKSILQRFETHDLAIKVLFTVAYSIIICLSVFGNLLVCQTVLKNWRPMRTTRLFILNLGVADLLITLLNSPFALVRFVSSNWVFGPTMCHVSWFSQYCSLYVLTLTLMAITLDQYQAILNPLKPRMSLSKGILCIVIIWTLASCFSLPHAIYQTLFHYVYREKIIRNYCVPTFQKPSEVFRRYFDVSTFTLFYVVPLVVITVASVVVSKKLLMRETIGAVTEAEAAAQRRRKRRTIKMIFIIMAFTFCWFPLNVYTIQLTGQLVQFNNTLYFAFHCVAVSSTCWNPFIYCWLDNRFRSDLMTLLAKCGGRRRGGKIVQVTAASGDRRQSGVRWEDEPGPSTENMSFFHGGRRGNNGEREDHQESLRPHFSEAIRSLQEELGPVNIRAALRPAVGGDHRSLRHREQEAMAEEKHWRCHGGPGRRLMPQEAEVHLDDRAAGGGFCLLLVPPQCLHLHALRPIQQHPPLCPPLGGRQQHLLEPHHLLLDGQQVPLRPHDPSGQVWGEKEERRQDRAAHRGQRRWEAIGVTLDDKPGPSTENRSFYLVGHRGKNGESHVSDSVKTPPIRMRVITSDTWRSDRLGGAALLQREKII